MSTEKILPGGHSVTRFWSRGKFLFIVHNHDRAFDLDDIAELARFAGFEVTEKPIGETGGSISEMAALETLKTAAEGYIAATDAPVLTKGGGPTLVETDAWQGTEDTLCDCGHPRAHHDFDETTLSIPCFAHVLGHVCPCETFKRARVRGLQPPTE